MKTSTYPVWWLVVLAVTASPTLLAQEASPHTVRVQALAELVIYPQRSAPATVISINNSNISAEVAARVVSLPIHVGDTVAKGQVLAELNCEEYQLQLRQSEAAIKAATAQVTLAEKQLTRAQTLVRNNNASKERLNLRQAELAKAQADLASAQAQRERDALNTSRCTILAPFPGVIIEKTASIGERVNTGTSIVQLLDNTRLEVTADVPLQIIDGLKNAGSTWFEVNQQQTPVKLRVIVPNVRTKARNREVRLVFETNPVLPGTAGRLTWQATNPHLPANMLSLRNNQLGVFLANDDQAHFKPLAGASDGRPVMIDLPLSSQVITDGRHGLRDGDPLSLTD